MKAQDSPEPESEAGTEPATERLTMVMAGRDDPFIPYLRGGLSQRFDVAGTVDAEMRQWQRLVTAAVTFRPSRRAWIERFFKSQLAISFRSANARRALAQVDRDHQRRHGHPVDVIFQTHALFELRDPRVVLYIDCTHHQSAQQWPDWNPLRGRALERWYARERRQYRAAAHVFAFSHETRYSLIEDYGVAPDKVTVVGAGLNFDQLPDPPTRAALDTHDGAASAHRPPTILFVGNDFVRKGGEQLLDAFRVVRATIPDARLRIVGTPHPIAAQPGVEIIGHVDSRATMSDLYAAADVFCLPSTFEPYGFVLVEAMANELPCIATTSCGIPEIIIDQTTGVLVARRADPAHPHGPAVADVNALACALINLLTDPERAHRLGRAGRRRVVERLQWPHVIDRMTPALRSLTAAATTTGPGKRTAAAG